MLKLRERLASRIAREHGYSLDKVDDAIETALEGRPFLEWLRSGGLTQLIMLILNILELFAENPNEPFNGILETAHARKSA
jgi:hypothetical protein